MIALTGPTACGKTRRAVFLAQHLNGEIVSADSRQVYRGMDIGTGKDIEEYGSIPVHMLDVAEAGTVFNLYKYLELARQAIDGICARGKQPFVAGGSGMYVENLIRGVRMPAVPENTELRKKLNDKTLDELAEILSRLKSLHNVTDLDTKARAVRAIEIAKFYESHPQLERLTHGDSLTKPNVIVLDIDREQRRRLISERLTKRLNNGMVDEVKSLLAGGVNPDVLINYGLEYKYITMFLNGTYSYQQMVSLLEIAIHQFAKRQMTWFRGMERRGCKTIWLPYNVSDDILLSTAKSLIDNENPAF